MITTVLAIFTLSAALGEAPPQIISAHKTYAECQNARRQPRWGRLARQKLLHELWEECRRAQLSRLVLGLCLNTQGVST